MDRILLHLHGLDSWYDTDEYLVRMHTVVEYQIVHCTRREVPQLQAHLEQHFPHLSVNVLPIWWWREAAVMEVWASYDDKLSALQLQVAAVVGEFQLAITNHWRQQRRCFLWRT